MPLIPETLNIITREPKLSTIRKPFEYSLKNVLSKQCLLLPFSDRLVIQPTQRKATNFKHQQLENHKRKGINFYTIRKLIDFQLTFQFFNQVAEISQEVYLAMDYKIECHLVSFCCSVVSEAVETIMFKHLKGAFIVQYYQLEDLLLH